MTTDQVLAELASVRRRFLSELEGFDEAHFARVPGPAGGRPGDWSAAQVAEHLARVESNILRGARHATEKGSRVRPGPLDPLRKLLLSSGLASLVRVRTIKGADPAVDAGEPRPRAQMFARLENVRGETVTFLEETRDRDLSEVYLRHPFFGAFPVRDMFGWAAWHEERHRRQLVRVRRAVGLS